MAAGNTGDLGLHGGADEPVVDAPDAPRVQLGLGAHDEQLAGPQRAGDLVGAGEQAAEAPGEGTDRRDVGPADEAHRRGRSSRSARAR